MEKNLAESAERLRSKKRLISLAVMFAFLAFLFVVPIAIERTFAITETLLKGRAVSDALLFVFSMLIATVIGALVYYIAYLKATSKLRIEVSLSEHAEEIAGSMHKFRKIFESAPIPYIILDPKGKIKDLNKAALRFFHSQTEHMVMTDLFSYIADEDSAEMEQLKKYYELKSSIEKREVRMKTVKGDVRWVQLSFFEISEPGSRDFSGFVSVLDITDQRNLDQAKTEFISLASHQMRTPLATVKWYTEMLLSPNFGELNPKQREYVATLNEVNRDMIELVDTILNVSRMEIGKLTVEKQISNIQEVVDSILVELSSQISKKKMNVEKEYNGLFLAINTDPKLLRIIIHNLLTNAIKYTPEGGRIRVSFEEKDGKGLITVSDTGCGIPANQQDKVFTKLFRADNVKNVSSSQSTGLGLYLIKSMTEAIGGTITFYSVENKGSSFTVTLNP